MTKRILLVDDHAMFRWGIGQFIASLPDFELAAEAADGNAAIQIMRQSNIDVILLDLEMPGLDGPGLLATIKSQKLDCPRIIILSQTWSDAICRKLQMQGIDGYVLKSEGIGELEKALNAVNRAEPYFSPGIAKRFWDMLPDSNPPQVHPLTEREMKVAQLAGQGLSNKEIAERLNCAMNTVKTHRANAMRKVGVKNAAELANWLGAL